MWTHLIGILVHPQIITPTKFNSSPLKNDGWKTTFPLKNVTFHGGMLNFKEGRVDDRCGVGVV